MRHLRTFVLIFALVIHATLALAQATADSYRVRVASGLSSREAANSLADELKGEGYNPVETVESGGAFAVMVGAARSEADAAALVKDLRSAGFTPEDIQAPGGAAPAASASPAPGSATGPFTGEKAFRVLVSEFDSEAEAESGRQALKDEGFSSIDIVEEGGKHRLFVGTFNSDADANVLLNEVRKAGFALASVVSVNKVATGGPAAPASTLAQAQQLSTEQRRTLDELSTQLNRAREGSINAREYEDLRRRIQEQETLIRDILKQQETAAGERAELQNRIWTKYREFENLVASKQYDAARAKLEEVRALDPNEASLAAKERRLASQGAGGAATAEAGTPATKGPDPEQVQAALAEARKQELSGNVAGAKQQYNRVLQLDPSNVEARGKVNELDRRQAAAETEAEPAALNNSQMMLYAGGGALVLALALLAYWQLVNARREKRLEQQVQELSRSAGASAPTTTPASSSNDFVDPLAPGGVYNSGSSTSTAMPAPGMAPMGSGTTLAGAGLAMPAGFGALGGNDDQEEEEEKPATPPPAPEPEPEPESDIVSLGLDLGPPPTTAPVTPSGGSPAVPPPMDQPVTSGDSVSLGDIGFDAPPIPSPTPEPPPAMETPVPEAPAASSSPSPADFDLDAILKGTFPGASPAAEPASTAKIQDITPMGVPELPEAPLPPADIPAPAAPAAESIAFDETVQIEGSVSEAPAAAGPAGIAAVAAQTAATSGDHFNMSFDDLPTGSQPSEWQGDYEYASLTVDDKNAANGSGKCLKFEKRSGAGSASYHCRFPNATGQVTVDFDIRCDDKNKYLLGFYVEKDEDFKQSVHTIVHRIDSRSNPSLRIQGEPVPYELGTWRHVRYELNLLTGVVNAYVNDQHVVKDAKLPTIPAFVNTFSIRDNLATTGLLYLDNLRVTTK